MLSYDLLILLNISSQTQFILIMLGMMLALLIVFLGVSTLYSKYSKIKYAKKAKDGLLIFLSRQPFIYNVRFFNNGKVMQFNIGLNSKTELLGFANEILAKSTFVINDLEACYSDRKRTSFNNSIKISFDNILPLTKNAISTGLNTGVFNEYCVKRFYGEIHPNGIGGNLHTTMEGYYYLFKLIKT